MPKLSKKLGVNAVFCVPWKSFRPLEKVKEVHPNDYKVARGDFVVTGFDDGSDFDGRNAIYLLLKSDELPGVELKCKAGAGKLVREGPPNQRFQQETTQELLGPAPPPAGPQEPAVAPQPAYNSEQACAGDVMNNFIDDGDSDTDVEDMLEETPVEIGDVIWYPFEDESIWIAVLLRGPLQSLVQK